jgi:hypothetical protein
MNHGYLDGLRLAASDLSWGTFLGTCVGRSLWKRRPTLAYIPAHRWGPVIQRQATLQCAGNRRSEMAAVKLVEGRAPWNHGEGRLGHKATLCLLTVQNVNRQIVLWLHVSQSSSGGNVCVCLSP